MPIPAMSRLSMLCLVVLLGVAGVVGYSYTLGQNSYVGTLTISIVDQIRTKVGGVLPSFPKKDRSVSMEAPEMAHASVRDACLETMFLEKQGFHFTQSRWGAEPVPYQFRGLQLIGPKSVPLNQADGQNGIDQRLRYEFVVDAYRRYVRDEGWEPWQFGAPPSLTAITLFRQNGEWKVASAPTEAYSVR